MSRFDRAVKRDLRPEKRSRMETGNEKTQKSGKSGIRLAQPVYIRSSASIVGKKEGEGPFGACFDMVGEDDLFGCNTWEEAESSIQKDAVYMVLEQAGMKADEIDFLFAGDLLGQSIATSFGLSSYQIPLFGVYGACSTCGETLTLGSMAIAGGYADYTLCVTSSHFASAEKEFRFPLGYGNQRPLSATWTVTGSGAFLLSKEPGENPKACITGMTPGKIVDYGLKDSMNMGACMAPAAADTIQRHLENTHTKPENYDKIITGDLGSVGSKVLLELLGERDLDIASVHMDCGIEIYDARLQDTHAGGSGCGCSAVMLSAFILKQLQEKKWKRILFVPTGALLSKTSFNEGQSIPGIAHAVVLETCKDRI